MSVKLSYERKRKPNVQNEDYLAVIATIKKGERGGVELHEAQVRLQSLRSNETRGPKDLVTIERLERTEPTPDPTGSAYNRSRIKWNTSPQVPRLKMPPGDEMQLATMFEVNSNDPYVIEAVFLARRIFLGELKRRFGRWRATIINSPSFIEPSKLDICFGEFWRSAHQRHYC
jgi:hypothetical protein